MTVGPKEPKMSVDLANDIAEDLPDGAYWAMMEELTGMDSCDIGSELAEYYELDDEE